MRPEQEYRKLYERMAEICEEQGWGDPFSYARSKEIYAATVLGHQVATTFSGADAFNQAKSTSLRLRKTLKAHTPVFPYSQTGKNKRDICLKKSLQNTLNTIIIDLMQGALQSHG